MVSDSMSLGKQLTAPPTASCGTDENRSGRVPPIEAFLDIIAVDLGNQIKGAVGDVKT